MKDEVPSSRFRFSFVSPSQCRLFLHRKGKGLFFFKKKRAHKQNVVHRWKKEQFAKQLLAAFPSRQNDTLCRVLLFLATFFGAIPTMDSIFI